MVALRPDASPMPPITLCEHSDAWRAEFEATADELRAALASAGARAPAIEHIGSTSVPGLCAKPVIDVLVGAPDLATIEARIEALRALGFRYRPEHETEIPDRRYFVREPDGRSRIHLHCVVMGGPLWRDHLAFRDALRRDAALASEYAALKRRLATEHADDKAAYTDAKAPFIARVLAEVGSP